MTSDPSEIRQRIWVTSRCHMNAERRNRFLEIYFHLLLAFYAVAGIGNSIIGSSTGSEVNGAVLLYVSILTLSISLLIFGFKFGEVAAQHRICYLALQRLYSSDKNGSISEKYISIIENLPNHSQMDFHKLVINNYFSYKQSLTRSDGRPYEFSLIELATYLVKRSLVIVFLLFLTTPAVLVTYWNFNKFIGW